MKHHNKGIHHISIISGEGQSNAEFYVNRLGLRMVLKTVNQDDPTNYHLFYANGAGAPGSSITFFPWPMAKIGSRGTGTTSRVTFAAPSDSKEYWSKRLNDLNIEFSEGSDFNTEFISFKDPDNLDLAIFFDSRSESVQGWESNGVPEKHSIRGFWSADLRLVSAEGTVRVLEDVMGFKESDKSSEKTLYTTDAPIGHSIIIEETGEHIDGRNGRGVVHHVAFRAKNLENLREMRQKVIDMGLSPTDVIDRHVFKSVYFMSPGGVLFEIASDDPGYLSVTDDESKMGSELFLPPWLEKDRQYIESRLPPIEV
jgi:glyoxalase family protein